VIADLSHIVEDSTARLNQMSHQEIAETFLRMDAITRRFLAAVNYHDNPALPHFHGTPGHHPAPPLLVVPTWCRCPHHTTLPGSFLPGAPSIASSLEDVSTRGPLLRGLTPGGPGPAPQGPAPAPTPVLAAPAVTPQVFNYLA
jgi:hypothetical protein